ncbi:MAG TPA: VOC family protein, partial [Chloroflexota bacterium]|nr:VOC family protein [Chloroflexota bacterium]
YVELISAQPGLQPQGRIGDLVASGREGWVGFALATTDPQAAVAILRERGLAVEGPTPGRLDSGDEFSRGWQVVWLDQPPLPGMPFLIRHDTSGAERQRLLAGTVGAAPHPMGARSIAGITVAVDDLESAVAAYERCFDLRPAAYDEDAMLAARTAALPLASGATITLAAPAYAGHGPVAQALSQHGGGLFSVTLAVADLAGAVRELRGRGIGVRVDEPDDILVAAQLNHRQIHGARLALVAAG